MIEENNTTNNQPNKTMSKSLHEILDQVMAKEATTEELIAAIKSGADVNEMRRDNGAYELSYQTLLQRVTDRGLDPAVVQALVDAGADVDAHATPDDLTDEDRELFDNPDEDNYHVLGYQVTPLINAVRENNPAHARILLEAGADVNIKCCLEIGDSIIPLTHAKSKEIIELLIQYGVDVNQVHGSEYCKWGDDDISIDEVSTKLEYDWPNLDPDCVLQLLKAGAAFHYVDEYIEKHPEVDADMLRSLASENNESLGPVYYNDRDYDDSNDRDDDLDAFLEELWADDDSDEETEDEDEKNEEEEEAKSQSLREMI